MAKQHTMRLLRRLTNLRTEVATGRTRNHYGVGRELTGEELSWRKTEIARLERWTGRAKKTSVRRTPGTARHSLTSTRLGDSSAIRKLQGLPAQSCNAMQKSCHAMKNRVKSYSSRPYVGIPENARPGKNGSWTTQQITEAADGVCAALLGPRVEALAADVQPELFWCEDLRRQLMAAGESPQGGHQQRSTAGAQPGVPGRAGARDFFEAAEKCPARRKRADFAGAPANFRRIKDLQKSSVDRVQILQSQQE